MRVALALYGIREGNYIPGLNILRELFLHSLVGVWRYLILVWKSSFFVCATDGVEKIFYIFRNASYSALCATEAWEKIGLGMA